MAISQDEFDDFLTDISVCFLKNDFETWESRVLLPLTLVAPRGPITIDTRAALRINFGHYIGAGNALRLDSVFRDALQLEDCGDGTWLGTYETRLISRGGLAIPPYVSTALLHDEDGRARTSSIYGARSHSEWLHPG